jgi:hypothetical protein
MLPGLSDLLRTIAALPLIGLLYTLGSNEYFAIPVFEQTGCIAVVAAGLAWRIAKKERAHTAFWLTVFLCLYSFPLTAGGYVFTGVWTFPIAGLCLALAFGLWRKAHVARRIGLGIVLAALLGVFFVHYFRNLDFDETFGRCRKEEARLDPLARILDRAKHPYDFAVWKMPVGSPQSGEEITEKKEILIATYGWNRKIRRFEIDSGRLVDEIALPSDGQVQRLAVDPGSDTLFGPQWGRWGQNESVLALNLPTGKQTQIPVSSCRNICEIAIEENSDRLYALCEVSHTLVSIDMRDHSMQSAVLLPGRDAYDMALDPVRKRIVTTDFFSPYVTVVNSETMKVEKKIRAGWITSGIVFFEDHFYVAAPFYSKALEIDARTLLIDRVFKAGYGGRALEIDPTRKILFIGSYLDGKITAVDLQSGKTLKTAYAGMLMRGIKVFNDRLFLATGCGIKTIDLTAWLGPPFFKIAN